MDDRNQEVFRKYEIKVYNTYKARGAVILETDKGLMMLKSYEGSNYRVEFENILKEHLINQGYDNVDLYLRNIEGELITEDYSGNRYVLKSWFVGEECNLKETSDVLSAVSNLAVLHSMLKEIPLGSDQITRNAQGNLIELFDKRNRELKRVRTYILDKRQKNEFELCYINNYEKFYEQGLEAVRTISNSDYLKLSNEAMEKVTICHGNYTYHNVMMLRGSIPASAYGIGQDELQPSENNSKQIFLSAAEFSERTTATTNFDRAMIGIQVYDLYHYLRKVMEKNDWDVDYGSMILDKYNKVKSLSKVELKVLYALLLYPEKFWKITNFYYNSKKSWVPQRNIQKLVNIQEQYHAKDIFLNRLKELIV